jgi:NAD(P)-dependent dehydrogenase (short-subunit alcohol dehydrogenase family)
MPDTWGTGRIALVTGGASGIGAETCQVQALQGLKVAVIELQIDSARPRGIGAPGQCRQDQQVHRPRASDIEQPQALLSFCYHPS